MIERLIDSQLDMVVGSRVDKDKVAYRAGHRVGNRILSSFVAWVFGPSFNDMLSGYRVFSRRFVKSFPVLSGGFEIETELTVHALQLGLPVDEIETPYYARPEGSSSKLGTWRDGFRILLTIANLYRAERPLPFFACFGLIAALVSIGLAIPIIITFLETGLVPRLPTAVLATGLMLLGIFVCRDWPCAGHGDARQTGDEVARLPLPTRNPDTSARLNFFRSHRLVMITIT